jgi:hypothetical protein
MEKQSRKELEEQKEVLEAIKKKPGTSSIGT